MLWFSVQLLLILLFPALSVRLSQSKLVPKWLSPVVLCYLAGIIIGNFELFPVHTTLATIATQASILLALPLLLFSTNLKAWYQESGTALFNFLLFVCCGILLTTSVALFFGDMVEESWKVSGMIIGMFTGGTPNMNAIGIALDANQETIILLTAADILCSGLYLILLSSILHSFLGRFLPSFKEQEQMEEVDTIADVASFSVKDSLLGLALTILIILASVGLCMLIFGNLENDTIIILLLTTFSIIASNWPQVRHLKGTFETGEYFLLIFCVALGLLANFGEIISGGLHILAYTAIAMTGTILLHFFLAWLFKLDRDTVMIASTAGIFGPVFIGQVASAIGNKKLVFTGIALGLLGFAMGNYLGIGLGKILSYFLGI